MTTANGGIDEQAEEEAADWDILLKEAPYDAELYARFEQWRASREANAIAWAAIQQTGDLIGRMSPTHRAQWEPFTRDPQGAVRYPALRRKRWTIRVATVAGACAVVVLGVSLTDWRGIGADYVTKAGETRTFTLADGTRIFLAPRSALKLADLPGQRGVELRYGEGYFEVKHDPARPFSVAVDGVTVRDIGTAFDVAESDSGVRVEVAEGEVAVQSGHGLTRSLKQGEAAAVKLETGAIEGASTTPLIGGWRHNQLSLQDAPMAEAINRLRPFYRGKIVVVGRGLSKVSVTGFYRLDDPVATLKLMAEQQKVRVTELTPWLVLVTAF